MTARIFKRPVVLEPKIGKFRYVLTAADAGRVLLREWPGGHGGPKKTAAMRAVRQCLLGEIPPSRARRAFVTAAKESLILPDDHEVLEEELMAELVGSPLPCGQRRKQVTACAVTAPTAGFR